LPLTDTHSHRAQVGPPAEPGRSRPRRFAATAEKLVTSPAPDVEVVADLLGYSVRTRPDNQAVGWRETIKLHQEEKQVKKVRRDCLCLGPVSVLGH
jgi:long-chain acyl-CoA synthetase